MSAAAEGLAAALAAAAVAAGSAAPVSARRLDRALRGAVLQNSSDRDESASGSWRGWSRLRWVTEGRGRAGSTAPGPIEVAELADQIAALSRAGLSSVPLWRAVAEVPGPAQRLCRVVAAQVEAGARAGSGLRAAAGTARESPPAGLAVLALTCDVAESAGAPLADVLARFADTLRSDQAAAAERAAGLAGPRATAAILSWLPLGGLGLGFLLGANPVATLIGTPGGRMSLAAGCAFWFTGRRWTARMVRTAARAGT